MYLTVIYGADARSVNKYLPGEQGNHLRLATTRFLNSYLFGGRITAYRRYRPFSDQLVFSVTLLGFSLGERTTAFRAAMARLRIS